MPDRAGAGQGQGIGVFIEFRLGREFVGGELLGAVVSLLCKRDIGGNAVDFGLALGNDFGTGPDVDTLQFRISHRFLGFGLTKLGNQLRIVDDEQSCTRRKAFWPRATAIASSSRIGPRCAA